MGSPRPGLVNPTGVAQASPGLTPQAQAARGRWQLLLRAVTKRASAKCPPLPSDDIAELLRGVEGRGGGGGKGTRVSKDGLEDAREDERAGVGEWEEVGVTEILGGGEGAAVEGGTVVAGERGAGAGESEVSRPQAPTHVSPLPPCFGAEQSFRTKEYGSRLLRFPPLPKEAPMMRLKGLMRGVTGMLGALGQVRKLGNKSTCSEKGSSVRDHVLANYGEF